MEDGGWESGKWEKRLALNGISRNKVSYVRVLELLVANLSRYKILIGAEGVTRWRSCLRHCATSRKVAGSIPDGVIGNFY
jgi:hypothetical protein